MYKRQGGWNGGFAPYGYYLKDNQLLIEAVSYTHLDVYKRQVYSLTEKGKQQFETLMLEISCKPINIFLDFNAVIVNLDLSLIHI